MKWTTFDGREADTESADHQHLSNCVWYGVIFNLPKETVREYMEALRGRFNNKILPYRPIPWFKEEIKGLLYGGYVAPFNEHRLINVDGRIIGEILNSDHPCFAHLKQNV